MKTRILYLSFMLSSLLVFSQNTSVSKTQGTKLNKRAVSSSSSSPLPPSNLNIFFQEPLDGDSAFVDQPLKFTPYIEGENRETEVYLHINNTEAGYYKIKFGYDDLYIYGQEQNVVAGGNDTLEIVLKSFGSQAPWDKILIRPSAVGSLSLDKYITADTDDWTRIKIPLSDFDSIIDFSFLSFIEFPYSSNAGTFEIGIREVLFSGGTDPFEWFGANHYTNAHDGIDSVNTITAELKVPTENPLLADTVFLKVNNEIYNYSTNPPFDFEYTSDIECTDSFEFELVDTEGLKTSSGAIEVRFITFHAEDFTVIRLTFDQNPEEVQVSFAPLKYNKDFAFSFTIDDGKYDAYAYAFKLLNGGQVEETNETFDGLFFTDGKGNQIPFRASTAWNSVSSSFIDIHYDTPAYMTWDQLQELIDGGWGVMNHSYSHAAYSGTDYDLQISENQKAVKEHTGYEMSHFVIPSGDLDYIEPAFEAGMQAVYSNKIDFSGYNKGIDVDAPFDTHQLKIYRRYVTDDLYNTSNIMDGIMEAADKSQNGNHIWWHDFTHRVIPTATNGSLIWGTFKYYMQQVSALYGSEGSDRIWFAPSLDVLNYLKVREEASLEAININENIVEIYLDTSKISRLVPNYSISLNVSANAELLSVTSELSSDINFKNTSAEEKLITIEWVLPTTTDVSNLSIPIFEKDKPFSEFKIYPNPISQSLLKVQFLSKTTTPYTLSLINNKGQEIFKQGEVSTEGLNNSNFDLPKLRSGIYFLMIDTQGQLIKTEKIIIQ